MPDPRPRASILDPGTPSAPARRTGSARPRLLEASFGLGLLGSAALALGSTLVGRAPSTPLSRPVTVLLGLHETGRGHGLLLAGSLLLTVAWLVLGCLVRGREDGPRTVLRAAALWALPLAVTPPAFSADVWSYVANGLLMRHGLSPYAVSPDALAGPILHAVSPMWRHTLTPYGPLPLVWGGAASAVDASPWFGLYAFKLLAVLSLAGLAWGVHGLARRVGVDPAIALWLAVSSPFTLEQGIAAAHVDLLLAALVVAGVLAATRRRWLLAVLLVGLATAVKVPAVLAAAPVGLAFSDHGQDGSGDRRRHGRADRPASWTRVLGVGGAVLGAMGVVWVLGLVSGLGLGWVTGLRTPLSDRTPLAVTTDLGELAERWWGGTALVVAHGIGVVVLALITAVVVLRGAGRSARGAPDFPPAGPATPGVTASPGPSATSGPVVRAGAVVLTWAAVLTPVDHFWYALWCLPLLACAPVSRRGQRVLVAVTAMLGALASFDPALHLPHARIVVGIGMTVALLVPLLPWPRLRPRGQLVTSLTPKRAQAASQKTTT